MIKIGINGFGRIGRLVLRALLENYKIPNLTKLINYKLYFKTYTIIKLLGLNLVNY